MKIDSTLFLRGLVILIGAIGLALCVLAIPAIITESDVVGAYKPILFGLYLPAVPFFIALYEALKLLDFIDKNKAFSELSVNALKHIKYCALIISGLFALGMPYIFTAAQKDDAPGVAALGLVVVFASFVIAAFMAVLQRILQDAIAIKSENDLTV